MAIAAFVIALILSYFSTQEVVKDADIMLVLDVSGSMGDTGQYGTKLDDAKKSATEFLSNINPKLHIGLITFESDVYINAPLGSDKAYIIDQISKMGTGDYTSMGDAMAAATENLASEGRSNASHYIVLMTDGLSNDDDKYSPEEATRMAVSEGIIIYAVAFGGDADTDILQYIANETKGKYFYAASGSELVDVFGEISREINAGYYYGSRSLIVVAIFLIIFLPAIVKTGKVAVDVMKEKFMKG